MEVKEILLEAAELIDLREIDWMCDAIKKITKSESIPKEIQKVGFTKENYQKFIENNFPELKHRLFKDLSFSYQCPWIDTISPTTRNLVLESKVKFLKSLAK